MFLTQNNIRVIFGGLSRSSLGTVCFPKGVLNDISCWVGWYVCWLNKKTSLAFGSLMTIQVQPMLSLQTDDSNINAYNSILQELFTPSLFLYLKSARASKWSDKKSEPSLLFFHAKRTKRTKLLSNESNKKVLVGIIISGQRSQTPLVVSRRRIASTTGEERGVRLNEGRVTLYISSWSNRPLSSLTSTAILPGARNLIHSLTWMRPFSWSTPTFPPNRSRAYGWTMVESKTNTFDVDMISKYTIQGDSYSTFFVLTLEGCKNTRPPCGSLKNLMSFGSLTFGTVCLKCEFV